MNIYFALIFVYESQHASHPWPSPMMKQWNELNCILF